MATDPSFAASPVAGAAIIGTVETSLTVPAQAAVVLTAGASGTNDAASADIAASATRTSSAGVDAAPASDIALEPAVYARAVSDAAPAADFVSMSIGQLRVCADSCPASDVADSSVLYSLTPITVTGSYLNDETGEPLTGVVQFRLAGPMTDTLNGLTVPPLLTRVRIARDGTITLVLFANDDPTTAPAACSYEVVEMIDGAPSRSYSVTIPYTAPARRVTLADLYAAA